MIKTIYKLSFTALLLLGLTACIDNNIKKESEFKPTLPMPEWGNKLNKLGKIGLLYDAENNPIESTKVGFIYSEELKDYDKALKWYKYSDSMKSSADNSNYACYALQKLKNYDEAISWCNKAIELGSDKALFQLATTYYKKKDYDNSLKWFIKAYEKGNKNTYVNIALIHSKKKNYKEAEMWYKKAIQENDLSAYQDISIFYHEDLKDDIKASAYSIAVINTKYSKSSVLKLLRQEWRISYETIKKGYELQLNSSDFPIKYKGKL